MPLLAAHGLSLPASEPGARAALEGPVTLSLEPGARVAISGPSGAGKTTLLRLLAHLEPRATGELRFEGRPVAGPNVPAYRRAVQYLPQTPVRLPGTVEDNLRAAHAYRSAGAAGFDRGRAVALCEQLGLPPGLLEQAAATLSGGEAQRLSLARALALEPRVLLLDEPTASLDPEARELVERAVAAFCEEDPARALLLVSHDADQRGRVTRGGFVMARGGQLTPAGDAE